MANPIQVTILSVIQDPDATVINALYADNASIKVQKEYRISSFNLNTFKRIVQAQILSLATQTDAKTLPVGPFDPTITPPDPAPRDIYAANLRLFGQMNRAVAVGAKKNTDSDYVTLAQTIHDTFDSSYIDLF